MRCERLSALPLLNSQYLIHYEITASFQSGYDTQIFFGVITAHDSSVKIHLLLTKLVLVVGFR